MKFSIRLSVVIILFCFISACGGNSDSLKSSSSSTVNIMKTSSTDASSPSFAMASNGRAIAVWSEGSSARKLWINQYFPNSGWGTAQSVGTGIGDESEAKAAVNVSGFTVLIWIRTINNSREILAATYDPATGWSTPFVLDSSGLGMVPTVVLDDNGNATAMWYRYDAVRGPFMTSRFSSAGWETPQIFQNKGWQQTSGNSSGKVIAIWQQSDPDLNQQGWHNYNSLVRIFEPGLGWSATQYIGNNVPELDGSAYYNPTTTPGHYTPSVSIDSQGKALALWSEAYFQGDDYHITVNRYEVGSGWGTPLSIGSIPAYSTLSVSPFVYDSFGTAYISLLDCQYSYYSTLSNIFVATYKAATGWALIKVVDSIPYYCLSPLITAGKNGDLYLTWLQIDGNDTHLWSKKYSPISGWGTSNRLDNNLGSVGTYEASRDASGNIIVVWTQYSGSNWITFAKSIN